jgi:hypothetical protein
MDINKEKILKSVISSSITNIENMIEGKDLINNKKINKDFVNLNNNKYRKLVSSFIGNHFDRYNFDNDFSYIFNKKAKDIDYKKYLKNFKRYGFVILDTILPNDIVDDMVNSLLKINFENKPVNLQKKSSDISWAKFPGEIAKIDFCNKLLHDGFLLKFASLYFKANPVISSNMFWKTDKLVDKQDSTQLFHQDVDDIMHFKVFIYLNDIDSLEDGAHRYIKGSIKNIDENVDYKPRCKLPEDYANKKYGDDIVHHIGKKGTIIIEDTWGYHAGTPIKNKDSRLLYQITFGISTFPLQEGVCNGFFDGRYIVKDDFMKKYPITYMFIND